MSTLVKRSIVPQEPLGGRAALCNRVVDLAGNPGPPLCADAPVDDRPGDGGSGEKTGSTEGKTHCG
jgi:hypothetical protein